MSKKRKQEKIGEISSLELLKKTRGEIARDFRTGYYQSEKDKPRKRFKARDIYD